VTDKRKDTTMKSSMKVKNSLAFVCLVVIMMFILNCWSCGHTSPPGTGTLGFLRVENGQIVKEGGEVVILRGFNAGPFKFASYKNGGHTLDEIDKFNKRAYKHFFTEQDAENIKSMGANVLRANSTLEFWTLETEPYQYDEGLIEIHNDLVSLACRNQIYVILSMGNAGQNVGQNEDGFGHTLWTDADLRSRVIEGWRFIAEHYADNPCVAGYDIMNEPDPDPSPREALHSFYSDVISAIRSVDEKHIIFLGKKSFPGNETEILWGGTYDDENIVLEFHMYEDANENSEQNPEGVDYPTREELETEFEQFFSLPQVQEQTRNRPIYLGEFSALWGSGDEGVQWTADVIEISNQRSIHWTYFSYKSIYGFPGRGLYVSPRWWLFDWTEEQDRNLEATEEQLNRLYTMNYQTNPDVLQLLENGFRIIP